MAAPTIIFISGWATPAEAFARTVEQLSGGYNVVLASCGDLYLESDEQKTPFEAQEPSVYAESLIEMLDEYTNGRPPIVIGWSMGGMVGLEAAMHAPNKIAALGLIGSTLKFAKGPDYDIGVDQKLLEEMAYSLGADVNTTIRNFYDAVYSDPGVRAAANAEIEERLEHTTLDQLLHGLRYLNDFDLRKDAKEYLGPLFAIHGTADRIIPANHFARVKSAFGEREKERMYWLLQDCGHGLVEEQPQLVAEKIEIFLDNLISGNLA